MISSIRNIESPDEHRLLMTEVCWNPKANSEKTTQIVFERFNFPAFYLANQSALSLLASGSLDKFGRTSGVVFSSGVMTSSVPVYEGYAISDAATINEFSGKNVTDNLSKYKKKGVTRSLKHVRSRLSVTLKKITVMLL